MDPELAQLGILLEVANRRERLQAGFPRGLLAGMGVIGEIGEVRGQPPRQCCVDRGAAGLQTPGDTPPIRMPREGLAALVPNALIVHAKTYDLDAEGNVPEFDFPRCLKIVRDAGYDGHLSIEFEGKGNQYEGVQRTIELIRRVDPSVE